MAAVGSSPVSAVSAVHEHDSLITIGEGSVGDFGAIALHRLAEDRGLKSRTLPDIFQDQDKPEIMYAQTNLDRRSHRAYRVEGHGQRPVE